MTKLDITHLTATDFMMMDLHRPPGNDETDQTQAVDKTIGAGEEELDTAPGVASASARCLTCFAPMPCAEHANVEHLNIVTTHDIEPTSCLADAHDNDLKEVVIVGVRHDGIEYFSSSVSDAAASMYHLQRGIYKLNKIVDEGAGTNDHPDDAA